MTKKKDTILTLSASRVKTYQQCPRRYYYTYIEKLPRKEWDHFILGTLAHGVLEFFHQKYMGNDPDKNLKKLMKVAFKKQKDDMQKKKEIAPDILLKARDFMQKYLLNLEENGMNSRILSLEENFNIKLNDKYSIQGVVDRIDVDSDDVYHIKDYKTNKNVKYMEPSQLRTYGIHLLDKHPEVDIFRGSYIMLQLNGTNISYTFNKEDVEKERKYLIKCGDMITEEERWITRPTKLCNWCDFKDPCGNTW